MRRFSSLVFRAVAFVAIVVGGPQSARAACEALPNSPVPGVPLGDWYRLFNTGGRLVSSAFWLPGDDVLAVRYQNYEISVVDLTKSEPVVLGPLASEGYRYAIMRVASTGEFIEPRGQELVRYDARTLQISSRSPYAPPNTKHTFIMAGKPERVVMLPEGGNPGERAVLGLAFALDGKQLSSWTEAPQAWAELPQAPATGIAPVGHMVRHAEASDARGHSIVWSFHSGGNFARIKNAPFSLAVASLARDQKTWPPKVERIDLTGVWKGFGELIASESGSFLFGAVPESEVASNRKNAVWPTSTIWPGGFADSTFWTKNKRGGYDHQTVRFAEMPAHLPARNGYGDKRISDVNKRIYVLSYAADRVGSTAGYGGITAYAFDGSMKEYCAFRGTAQPRLSPSAKFVSVVNDKGVTVYKVGER